MAELTANKATENNEKNLAFLLTGTDIVPLKI
jgi:hypothetical protein